MVSRKESGEARKTARTAGDKIYKGQPCNKHPENCTRWVINGCCIMCTREGLKPYRQRNAVKLAEKRKEWDVVNPEKAMIQRARRRAKEMGLDFTLTPTDIVIPVNCPVLGIALSRHDHDKDVSPSLDRIDNTKGYIQGNVVVVSFKANRIKNNATIDELRKVVDYYGKN